ANTFPHADVHNLNSAMITTVGSGNAVCYQAPHNRDREGDHPIPRDMLRSLVVSDAMHTGTYAQIYWSVTQTLVKP
ncbi:hypothetical protein AX16_000881, partial [Volvariella volvacea WC 439]